MAWNIRGNYYGPCSCKVSCPCALGEMEADEGWCSGALAFDITSGKVNDVDVSGVTAVLDGDWPSGFLGGNGTARMYLDPSVSKAQQAALEGLFTGELGGVFEVFATLVNNVLPTKEASINLDADDDTFTVRVGDFGLLTAKTLRGADGRPTKVLNGAAHFRDEVILAKGVGTYWRDPEMREWESGGHAERWEFEWSDTHEH